MATDVPLGKITETFVHICSVHTIHVRIYVCKYLQGFLTKGNTQWEAPCHVLLHHMIDLENVLKLLQK